MKNTKKNNLVKMSFNLLLAGVALLGVFESTAIAARDEEPFVVVGRRGLPRVRNHNSQMSNSIQVTAPNYSGTGCPDGSASVTLSPDKRSISMIFDEFIVEAGGEEGDANAARRSSRNGRTVVVRNTAKRQRKDCVLNIPFQVPEGFRAKIVRIDYRGFNMIPEGGKNIYTTRYTFFDNATGRRISNSVTRFSNFVGPLDDDYTMTSELYTNEAWSGCGKNFNMNVRIAAISSTNRDLEETMATVDSVDTVREDSKLEYHMLWEKCTTTESPRSPRRGRRRPRSRRFSRRR
ncbi:MAG: DUF4360 domain-containing protein [Bacteriovoracaceae bacterium]|nr:DUF4360 domain-containing protein [Bacteriovoracaceae bacterium]